MNTLFKNTRSILAFIFVIFSFGFLYAILFVHVPAENRTIINVSIGYVLGVLTAIAAYYWGSSKDKSDQDKANNPNIPKETPPPGQ